MHFLLLTGTSAYDFEGTHLRSIGAYQLSWFLESQGISVSIIDNIEHFTHDELLKAISERVAPETIAIGVSSSFLTTGAGKIGSSISGFVKELHVQQDEERAIPRSFSFTSSLLDTLREVKRRYPGTKLVLGGSQVFVNDPIFDCRIWGYAEDKTLEYLLWLKGKYPFFKGRLNGAQVEVSESNEVRFDISMLEHRFKDEHHIQPGEALPIEVSRGCIFKCKFCAYPLIGKKKLDYLRVADLVAQELEHNYSKWGTTTYYLCDETFNDSPQKLEALHAVFIKLPFKVRFISYARADLFHAHPRTLDLVEEMGALSFFFGIETLNEKAGKLVGKGFTGERMKQHLLYLQRRWEGKLNFQAALIAGLPGEDEASIRSTHAFLRDSGCAFWRFNALTVADPARSSKFYKSTFELEADKYGFKFPHPNTLYWETADYSYRQALDLTNELNFDASRYAKPTAWNLASLLTLGADLSIMDVSLSKISTIPWVKRRVAAYKRAMGVSE